MSGVCREPRDLLEPPEEALIPAGGVPGVVWLPLRFLSDQSGKVSLTPPCPIITCPCKKSVSRFLAAPSLGPGRYIRCLWRLLMSRMNNPNCLSLASFGLAPSAPHPSHAGHPRAACDIPGRISWEWSRGRESPPSACWLSRAYNPPPYGLGN